MNKLSTALVVVALAGPVGVGLGVGATASAADGPSSAKRPVTVGKTLAAVRDSDVSAQAASVTPVGRATLRLGGANRWETAQAVSQVFWEPEDTFVVALVSGENFPDSLSLPPTVSQLGPTLLVQRGALPAATRAELQRLRPCFVVAAGGAGVISDAVLRDADRYADPTQPGCE